MIVTEYMENGSLDTFLKVRVENSLVFQNIVYLLIIILRLNRINVKAIFLNRIDHITVKKLYSKIHCGL